MNTVFHFHPRRFRTPEIITYNFELDDTRIDGTFITPFDILRLQLSDKRRVDRDIFSSPPSYKVSTEIKISFCNKTKWRKGKGRGAREDYGERKLL